MAKTKEGAPPPHRIAMSASRFVLPALTAPARSATGGAGGVRHSSKKLALALAYDGGSLPSAGAAHRALLEALAAAGLLSSPLARMYHCSMLLSWANLTCF